MSKYKKLRKRYIALGLLAVVVVGTAYWYANRPDYEDFDFEAMILEADIQMESVPQEDPMTSDLLERFKPRLYVAKDSYKPVDFYADYVDQSTLYRTEDGDKILVSDQATTEELMTYSGESDYYIDYQIPYQQLLVEDYQSSNSPKFYGRVYRSELKTESEAIPLLFLKYSFAYPYSGLPEGTKWWKKLGGNIIGNTMTWHELDIHGAVHIVLHEETLKPLGVILAQHNHHRVFLNEIDIEWPEDERLEIVVAKYSNEPYLLTDGQERYERVVGNPFDIEFLFGITDKEPLTAGSDCVPKLEDTVEIEGEIVQLAFDDPLYTSSMGLGDRKTILGFRTWFMDGPPGMDFYAMPALLDLSNTMAFWYINPEDAEYLKLLNETELSFMTMEIGDLLAHQKQQMVQHLQEILKTEN
jgi:hypothetical protein